MDDSNNTAAAESGLDRLIGYNDMKLDGRDEFPCPFEPRDEPCDPESPPPFAPWSVPEVSPEDAVAVLRTYASERGLDTRVAAEACVTGIEVLHTFRYRLETFTERRFTRWTTEPFTGEQVEDSSTPPSPPLPWDIPVEQPVLFRANSKDVPISGTAVVQDCSQCRCKGQFRCFRCTNGKVDCYNCHGKGWTFNFTSQNSNTNHCYICSGRGVTTCVFCRGDVQRKCPVCRDHKKTIRSIALRVKWTNFQDEELCGNRNVPHAGQLPGRTVMTHTARRVSAIVEFPEPSLVQASQRLVQEHADRYSDTRILQQTVELLCVTKVFFSWRRQSGWLYINAVDGTAIVDNYPQPTCSCCVVM